MKKFYAFIFAFLLAVPAAMYAGDRPQTRFIYDVDFGFRFDNREYDRSSFSPSMTIFGARITPSAGLQIQDSGTSVHKLLIGIDIMKDFGASPVPAGSLEPATATSADGSDLAAAPDETSSSLSNWDLFRELIFYYKWEKSFARTDMTLAAGIFPRKEMEGRYSTAFFSSPVPAASCFGLSLRFVRPAFFDRALFAGGEDSVSFGAAALASSTLLR